MPRCRAFINSSDDKILSGSDYSVGDQATGALAQAKWASGAVLGRGTTKLSVLSAQGRYDSAFPA